MEAIDRYEKTIPQNQTFSKVATKNLREFVKAISDFEPVFPGITKVIQQRFKDKFGFQC
ncbi:MAG: hypothetical protein K2P93_09375 [Alphaproteobacteria bacterium]|nr:hypothetical protein [Alphaproteobacteria bacterium]